MSELLQANPQQISGDTAADYDHNVDAEAEHLKYTLDRTQETLVDLEKDPAAKQDEIDGIRAAVDDVFNDAADHYHANEDQYVENAAQGEVTLKKEAYDDKISAENEALRSQLRHAEGLEELTEGRADLAKLAEDAREAAKAHYSNNSDAIIEIAAQDRRADEAKRYK